MRPNKSLFIYLVMTMMVLSEGTSQVIWLESEKNKGKEEIINHVSSELLTTASEDRTYINYNPAFKMDALQQLDLKGKSMNQCNIFTVFQPNIHSQESLIWSLRNDNNDQLLLTDMRAADLVYGKFMNFIDFNPAQPQINVYHHYKSKFEANKIELGGQPSNDLIPVNTFDGQLAELIVFDHVLAPAAKARLESALAIKYSIPLAPGHDYIDVNGRILWNATEEESFSNNIAGIGKNTFLKLHQKQSKSAFGKGHIAIGVEEISVNNQENTSSIPEGSYLLWGDDDGLLEFTKVNGKPDLLERKWLLNPTHFNENQNLELEFNHLSLLKTLTENESIWLVVGEFKNENFEIKNSSFYKLDDSDNGKDKSIRTQFQLQSESQQIFSFFKAPQMWANLDIIHADCVEGALGSVSVFPLGGTGPFSAELKNKETGEISSLILDRGEHQLFDNLENGHYAFSIHDTNDSHWTTTFYIQNKNIQLADLNDEYVIENEKYVFLDASENIESEYEYIWTTPNDEQINEAKIALDQEGTYTLEVIDGNCKSWFQVNAIQVESNIQDMLISPNPSVNGYFQVHATLHTPSPYSVNISTLDRKRISTEVYPESKYIQYSGHLAQPGMYLISIRANQSTYTQKLIISSPR